jgi:hypothetical protein
MHINTIAALAALVAAAAAPSLVTGTIKTETAFTSLADAGYSIDAETVEPRKQ